MGIQTFGNGSGNRIDLTALTLFTKDATGVTGTGVYQTILGVNGKGFLESFYLRGNHSGPYALRITVDGVVKVLLTTSTQAVYIGVFSQRDMLSAGSSTSGVGYSSLRIPGNTNFTAAQNSVTFLKSYPVTDNSEGVVYLGSVPIYFYQSLLLETNVAANGSTYGYTYSGGYQ